MKKILVTGGTGYIGSHTAVELIEAGYEVVIIDNLSNSTIDTLARIKKITGVKPLFEEFDLINEEKLDMFFGKHNIDGVIHFAALKAVAESVREPIKYYKNNLYSSVNLFEAMKKHGVKNIIFSSSASVYGEPDVSQVTEETPVKKAENPYGNTKKIVEDILQDISKTKCLNAIALRYFNVIGAHDSRLIGDTPVGEPENLMPYITQTAIGIREQLNVFGDDYDTRDGTCIRDYIHVVDLAKAHVKALKRLLDRKNKNEFEIYNLGTGNGCSVLDLIKKFEQINDIKINYKIVGRRAGDPVQYWADASLANKELDWKAERGIEDMVRSAWEWEKSYRDNN